MLLDNNVVADREAKTSAFSGRLGREKRVEHLFFYVRRHTDAVVANSDFHTIAKIFGRGCESRLVVATISLCSAPGRSIEAVCNQIKKSSSDVLRENVCPTGRQPESEDDILIYAVFDDELEQAASDNFSLGNCTDARVCPIAE
jgi:hypothetical protein